MEANMPPPPQAPPRSPQGPPKVHVGIIIINIANIIIIVIIIIVIGLSRQGCAQYSTAPSLGPSCPNAAVP